MKPRNILLISAILLCTSAGWSRATSINETIKSINADAQKPGGPERVLKSISASTHVPVATLAKEKDGTGLSYGDLYIAHAIASASGKKFAEIASLKGKGQGWDKIANDNNVSLGGKKVKKDVANTKPTPAPRSTPQNLRQPDTTSGYRTRP